MTSQTCMLFVANWERTGVGRNRTVLVLIRRMLLREDWTVVGVGQVTQKHIVTQSISLSL